jgi:hypothetical protein
MIDGSHLRFESIAHDHDGHDRTGSLCLRSDQPRVCFWAHRWWLFQSRLFRTPSASCVSRHPTPPAPGGFGPCGQVSHMCLFLPNASVDATRYYYGWNSFFWSTLFLSRCAIFIRLETRRVGLPFCVRTFYLRFDASQHLVSYSFWLVFLEVSFGSAFHCRKASQMSIYDARPKRSNDTQSNHAFNLSIIQALAPHYHARCRNLPKSYMPTFLRALSSGNVCMRA